MNRLTERQFKIRLKKIRFLGIKNHEELLLLGNIMALAMNDIRFCKEEELKYPLSLLLLSICKSLMNLGSKFDLQATISPTPSLSYYFSLAQLQSAFTAVLSVLGSLALNPTPEKTKLLITGFHQLLVPIMDIITYLVPIDLEEVLSLSIIVGKKYGGDTDYTIKKYDALRGELQSHKDDRKPLFTGDVVYYSPQAFEKGSISVKLVGMIKNLIKNTNLLKRPLTK